jgi:hypothetical protein
MWWLLGGLSALALVAYFGLRWLHDYLYDRPFTPRRK